MWSNVEGYLTKKEQLQNLLVSQIIHTNLGREIEAEDTSYYSSQGL